MAPVISLLGLLYLLVLTSTSLPTDMQSYIVHMDASKMATLEHSLTGTKRWHDFILDSIIKLSSPEEEEQEAAPSPQLLYVYDTALSGFAAKLSSKQFESLHHIDGFLSAFPDEMLSLHTSHTPQFLGLKHGQGLWSSPNLASDIIIGVIDTGIWPEHISFSDNSTSAVPKRWKGECEAGTKFTPNNCNKKLIGARAFWKGYEAMGGGINETKEYRSARDSQGHGTHTASTAAGNVINGASLFGNARGSATGMRYTARIASYKACWEAGCASSDILAAVDRAVADGVDVLSLSLGGTSRPYFLDSIAIAAFGAIKIGVFVSCSAGNLGPSESTVTNSAPWIMTVAASYLDRSFPTAVKLSDGRIFSGASLYTGKPTKPLPIVYGATAGGRPGAGYCTAGSLSPKLVRGKMVLCKRGLNGRTDKGGQVKAAGGSAMLLLNSKVNGEELFADPHILPTSSLGAAASSAIKNYSLTAQKPTATITFLGTLYGNIAPIMTAFSSRGPSSIAPEIIKPDVTAPGMSILAAWPPSVSTSLLDSDKRRASFNIISGTSMSCPHISGLAALIKSAHPDWSPAAIKSALMTTAYTLNNRNTSITSVSTGSPANPFDFGSGHVDPERAAKPGLIYDIGPIDYLNYLCSVNYTSTLIGIVARGKYTCPKGSVLQAGDLNYPSFSVLFDVGNSNARVVHKRTVTSVGPGRCTYTVVVREPKGVTVRVEPSVLAFAKMGQKLEYKVRFVDRVGKGSYSFGDLVWVCREFLVRSPIAVTWQ